MDEKGNRKDVNKEFVFLFDVFDENSNWYVDENIEKYIIEVLEFLDNFKVIFDFWESNFKVIINGYVYGNFFVLMMYSGEKVIWYFF